MCEPNLNPPEDEWEDCEVFCPECEQFLDWDDKIYYRNGVIIGCELCIGSCELGEWIDDNTPSEEDILAEIGDIESHRRREEEC